MSASRERRERQALRATGQSTDKRIVKKKKADKTKDALTRWVVGIFVGIIGFTLVVLFLMGQGIPQRTLNAADINGEKIKINELEFHYYLAVSSFVDGWGEWLPYVGFDPSQPHESQQYFDEPGYTYRDYFLDEAMESLRSTVANWSDARANGVELTEDDIWYLEYNVEDLKRSARENNMSLNRLLTTIFGRGVTEESFRSTFSRMLLADRWRGMVYESYEVTENMINAHYWDNRNNFDQVTFYTLTLSGEPESDCDDDDHDHHHEEPTEEERAAAMEDASRRANEMLAAVNAGNFHRLALEYCDEAVRETLEADSTATFVQNMSLRGATGSAEGDWLADFARVPGDKTVIEDGTSFTVMVFVSRRLDAGSPTDVDVRHILVPFRENQDGPLYDVPEAEETAARMRANQLLYEWKSNGGTEDLFAEMADEHSSDPGSNGTRVADGGNSGGLYEGVTLGSMVEEFEEWCFNGDHSIGDTGIVRTVFGYHIMYLVRKGDPAWITDIRNTLKNDAFREYQENLAAGFEVKRGNFALRFW